MAKPKDPMSVTEAAEYLRVHRQTIIIMIKRGKLPAARIGGSEEGEYRIRRADLDALYQTRSEGGS